MKITVTLDGNVYQDRKILDYILKEIDANAYPSALDEMPGKITVPGVTVEPRNHQQEECDDLVQRTLAHEKRTKTQARRDAVIAMEAPDGQAEDEQADEPPKDMTPSKGLQRPEPVDAADTCGTASDLIGFSAMEINAKAREFIGEHGKESAVNVLKAALGFERLHDMTTDEERGIYATALDNYDGSGAANE